MASIPIPDAAVEALAKVVVEEGAYGVPWGDASDSDREDALEKARDYLEAAAPHLNQPRTITTAEELDALPYWSVILSGGVVPRIKASDNRWIGDGIEVDSEHIIEWTGYATFLHEPAVAK